MPRVARCPAAPARHNVVPDPPDGFADITVITKLTGPFAQRDTPSLATPPGHQPAAWRLQTLLVWFSADLWKVTAARQ